MFVVFLADFRRSGPGEEMYRKVWLDPRSGDSQTWSVEREEYERSE